MATTKNKTEKVETEKVLAIGLNGSSITIDGTRITPYQKVLVDKTPKIIKASKQKLIKIENHGAKKV